MKNLISLAILVLTFGSLTLKAGIVPGPSDNPDENKKKPVGGTAPVSGAVTLLLTMGTAYGIKKNEELNSDKQIID